MKAEHKRKLIGASYDMAKMLGVQAPHIFFDKQPYEDRINLFGIKNCHRLSSRNLGQCSRRAHAIFINGYTRKQRYSDYLNTLAHEFVHYTWKEIRHGKKFNAKVKEVLQEFRSYVKE